ncbi:unnamed protein product [Owenia fusiformis]|uniref:Uncharacterized protein n=1 Tax=Owenia fusiformis TaxID=6347 RepID=A0A8J1TQ88_OWEFU|nr:unnamed protein product [Owenia fusiformis]
MAYECDTPARHAMFKTATPVSKKTTNTFGSPFSIRSLLNLSDETSFESTPQSKVATCSSSIMSSLSSHPADLTRTLAADINTPAKMSQSPKTVSPQLIPVPACISALEEHFYSLKHQMRDPTKLLELEVYYRQQVHQLEYGRYAHLTTCLPMYQHAINIQFDHQLRQLVDQVECSMRILETSTITKDSIRNNLTIREAGNSLESYLPQPIMTSTPKKKSGILKKKYRNRGVYSYHAKEVLETWYAVNSPYPTTDIILSLATKAGLSTSQVRKWFCNKRHQCGHVNRKLVRHLHQHNEPVPNSSVQSWM